MSGFYRLDLNKYLNHKIIDSVTTEDTSDVKPEPYRVVYHDELFKPGNLPASGESYEFEGIPFVFPDFSKEGYDNVCCEGQQINFPAGDYSKIHIVGFCECEGFTEKFTFISTDSPDAITVEIFLFNSWKGIEHWSHERNPEMCRNAFLATTVTESPRGVYCSSQKIEATSSKITSVILPFCAPMHIFSMTLE
ncbi:MAG: hypothetical protein ACYCYI_14595 [Saccharofermentanales bacterium]